jgi:hypothetical protein
MTQASWPGRETFRGLGQAKPHYTNTEWSRALVWGSLPEAVVVLSP